MSQQARIVIGLVLATVILTVFGTLGYHLLEGWPFGEALYMTIITLSTVGFGEVHPLGATGRVLTIFLILVGWMVLYYAASHFTAILVSGEIQKTLKGKRMERRIQQMKGHTVLCGFGRIGREIAREFQRAGRKLVIIDQSDEGLQEAREAGHAIVQGDATGEHTLEAANISSAAGLVAALPRDSDNLYVVLSARELNPELHIVARCLDIAGESRLHKAGAHKVVNPYVIGGRRLASMLLHPEIMDFLDLYMQQDPEGFSLRHLRVTEGSPLAGRTLAESGIRQLGHGVMVLGITRVRQGRREMLIPKADTALAEEDVMILLGTRRMFDALEAEGVCEAENT